MSGQQNLVSAAKNGDREAFGELYRQSYEDLYKFAFYVLKNDQDAHHQGNTLKSGKHLNSQLVGYKAISGKIDGFVSDSTSQVLETLYVTVYGVQD